MGQISPVGHSLLTPVLEQVMLSAKENDLLFKKSLLVCSWAVIGNDHLTIDWMVSYHATRVAHR